MNRHDQTTFVRGATKQEAQRAKEKKEVRMVWAFAIFAVVLSVGSWAAVIEYFSGFVRSAS